MNDETKDSFEEASRAKDGTLGAEFFMMLRHNKKYWLLPLGVILLLLAFLVVLGSTGAAPFIYTVF